MDDDNVDWDLENPPYMGDEQIQSVCVCVCVCACVRVHTYGTCREKLEFFRRPAA